MRKCIPSTEITAVITEYQSIRKKSHWTFSNDMPSCLPFRLQGRNFLLFFLTLSSKADAEFIIMRIRQGQASPIYPVLQTAEYDRQLERNIDLSNSETGNKSLWKRDPLELYLTMPAGEHWNDSELKIVCILSTSVRI